MEKDLKDDDLKSAAGGELEEKEFKQYCQKMDELANYYMSLTQEEKENFEEFANKFTES